MYAEGSEIVSETGQILMKSTSENSIDVSSVWLRVIRLLKVIGLFCKRALQTTRYSAKKTYNFKEPTNRSHLISSLSNVRSRKSKRTWRRCPFYVLLVLIGAGLTRTNGQITAWALIFHVLFCVRFLFQVFFVCSLSRFFCNAPRKAGLLGCHWGSFACDLWKWV